MDCDGDGVIVPVVCGGRFCHDGRLVGVAEDVDLSETQSLSEVYDSITD